LNPSLRGLIEGGLYKQGLQELKKIGCRHFHELSANFSESDDSIQIFEDEQESRFGSIYSNPDALKYFDSNESKLIA
jgi:hypothetical protein